MVPEHSSGPARRYVIVIQDPRGYPPVGEDLEPAPPEGPEQPMLHSAVLADDYDQLREAARDLLDTLDRNDDWPVSASNAIGRLRAALGDTSA